MGKIEQAVDWSGPILRLVTPFLCVVMTIVLGVIYFTIGNISDNVKDLNAKVNEMDAHFTNHLVHHQDLEVSYADRLAKIEGNRFTDRDAFDLEQRVTNRMPPKWVADVLVSHEKRIEKLENNK